MTVVVDVDVFAERLWVALLDADEEAAFAVLLDALSSDLDGEALLLDVIGAVQRRVGAEWALDQITVAQEHAATAINERIIVRLADHLPDPEPRHARVTVACVDGEWHALPARLLAEVLRLRGFDVDYLGSQVPTVNLITHLHRTSPDVVALSGSLPIRLPDAHATITACQSAGVPVIVGGAAFGSDGRWAHLLGAQAWASDARAAADRLLGPLPRPRPGHQPIDDLPHLGDQEYTMVTRSAPHLVRAVVRGLGSTSEEESEQVAETVSFLAASLYVGDPAVFTDYLTWTAEVLGARGVPAGSLLPVLELLATELRDFPRAATLLRQGAAALGST